MAVELKVPDVGESVSEVFIGTWLKREGEAVTQDEPLVELETDKATVEVPSSVSGKLAKVLKKQGDSAQVGEVIAHLEEGEAGAAVSKGDEDGEASAAPQELAAAEASSAGSDSADASDGGAAADGGAPPSVGAAAAGRTAAKSGEPRIMPAAQRLLEEHDIRPDQVEASGPGGRLLKEDVQRHMVSSDSVPSGSGSTGSATTPAASARAADDRAGAQAGTGGERQEEVVPMSPLRRRIAERLVEAQRNAALLTTFNEIDMSQVMELRKEYRDTFEKRYGVRLGFMSFFVKAVIDGLKGIPQLNAEIRDSDIVYKNYFDIGVAVSTPKGLVVPVLRNADRMSFAQVETAIGDFGTRAQANKITPGELQGGTFTISNGGVFGSLMSTPIVNPPQSGVLGMHTIQQRPVAVDGQVEIRPMMYIALSYDHRIVDGREAVTFLKRIKEAVERPTRMLLEV
ncbi:MAG: 2-oxoglutarate dehydrogenase complex dihydrolipoyllysine-residue succinyltransferase [Trueperaceae bacterium]